MSKRADREAKARHDRWLAQQGLLPAQLKAKSRLPMRAKVRALDRQAAQDNLALQERAGLAEPRGNMEYVPKRNTDYRKPVEGMIVAPAYNKGPYMVIAKADLPTAGKKV